MPAERLGFICAGEFRVRQAKNLNGYLFKIVGIWWRKADRHYYVTTLIAHHNSFLNSPHLYSSQSHIRDRLRVMSEKSKKAYRAGWVISEPYS